MGVYMTLSFYISHFGLSNTLNYVNLTFLFLALPSFRADLSI